MSYPAVNIYLVDVLGAPITSALVKFFDQAGATAITEGTTDSTGLFSCILPAPQTYQVRCYKQQVTFGRPQLLQVVDPPAPNDFNITGTLFVPPTAVDPRLCMASGFFRGPNGDPAVNVAVHFIALFDPLLLDGAAVLAPERVREYTDGDGFMRVQLIRNGKYDVMIQGMEDLTRAITVPGQPEREPARSAVPRGRLDHLLAAQALWPCPSARRSPSPPPSMTSTGEQLHGVAIGDVFWRSSDIDVLAVKPSGLKITLRGVGARHGEHPRLPGPTGRSSASRTRLLPGVPRSGYRVLMLALDGLQHAARQALFASRTLLALRHADPAARTEAGRSSSRSSASSTGRCHAGARAPRSRCRLLPPRCG